MRAMQCASTRYIQSVREYTVYLEPRLVWRTRLFSLRAQLEALAKKGLRVKAKMAGSMACSHTFSRRRGSSATYTRTRTRSGTAERSLARPTIGSRDYGASQLAAYIFGNWNLETGNGILECGKWNGTYRPPYFLYVYVYVYVSTIIITE